MNPQSDRYKRWGMHLAAVHRGAIAESGKLKPEISLVGVDGRPIEDEIEFELLLGLDSGYRGFVRRAIKPRFTCVARSAALQGCHARRRAGLKGLRYKGAR